MILILSDIHDRKQNLQNALNHALQNFDIDLILALGDYINPGIPTIIAEKKIKSIGILGNNDGDPLTMYIRLHQMGYTNFELIPRIFYEFSHNGRKIFMTHYPKIGQLAAKAGEYDAVFYGHDHIMFKDKINKTLLCNPGEISGHKTGKVSYAVYDDKKNTCEIITI